MATREFATPLHFLLVVFIIVFAHDRRAWSMENRESRIVIRVGNSQSVLECGSPLSLWDHRRNSAFSFDPRFTVTATLTNDLDAGSPDSLIVSMKLSPPKAFSIRDASTLRRRHFFPAGFAVAGGLCQMLGAP